MGIVFKGEYRQQRKRHKQASYMFQGEEGLEEQA